MLDQQLDYNAEERVLGRQVGDDLFAGNVSLRVILMLLRTDESTRALVRAVVSTRQVTPEAWDVIKDQLQRHGAVELAYQRSVTYAEEAKRAITAAFGPSAERESLVALCDYVLSRDR